MPPGFSSIDIKPDIGYFQRIFGSRMKKTNNIQRIISAAVLLFVFFLPLHFHFSSTVKLSKECSCLQGTRTQMALAPESATSTPIFEATLLPGPPITPRRQNWANLQNVRAPPSTL